MENRKSKRGPKPIETAEKRTHTVSVRLNAAELDLLDKRRGKFLRGEWMRMAALEKLPPSIPAVNLEAWQKLARSSANLNQIALKLNGGHSVDAAEIARVLAEFRLSLLGAQA